MWLSEEGHGGPDIRVKGRGTLDEVGGGQRGGHHVGGILQRSDARRGRRGPASSTHPRPAGWYLGGTGWGRGGTGGGWRGRVLVDSPRHPARSSCSAMGGAARQHGASPSPLVRAPGLEDLVWPVGGRAPPMPLHGYCRPCMHGCALGSEGAARTGSAWRLCGGPREVGRRVRGCGGSAPLSVWRCGDDAVVMTNWGL